MRQLQIRKSFIALAVQEVLAHINLDLAVEVSGHEARVRCNGGHVSFIHGPVIDGTARARGRGP